MQLIKSDEITKTNFGGQLRLFVSTFLRFEYQSSAFGVSENSLDRFVRTFSLANCKQSDRQNGIFYCSETLRRDQLCPSLNNSCLLDVCDGGIEAKRRRRTQTVPITTQLFFASRTGFARTRASLTLSTFGRCNHPESLIPRLELVNQKQLD